MIWQQYVGLGKRMPDDSTSALPMPPDGSPAAHLLRLVTAAGLFTPDTGVVSHGMDIPKPSRLYSAQLIGGSWPTLSESGWDATIAEVARLADKHEAAASIAWHQSDNTFNNYWPSGNRSRIARELDDRLHEAHLQLVALLREMVKQGRPLGGDIRSAKRSIDDTDRQMHAEIETYLRGHSGVGPVSIGPIIASYRPLVEKADIELKTYFEYATTGLGNKFGKPPESSGPKHDDNSRHYRPQSDQSPDGDTDGSQGTSTPDSTATTGRHYPGWTAANAPAPSGPSWTTGGNGRLPGVTFPALGGSHGGSAGSSLGGLSGLSTGFAGGGIPGIGNTAAGASPLPPPLVADFGRGAAAGIVASGAPVVPPAPPITQPPTPLAAAPAVNPAAAAAPTTSGSPSPATAPPPGAAAPISGAGAPAAAAPEATTMGPYGSVLPPAASGTPTNPAGTGVPSAGPAAATGGGAGASGGPTSFVPVATRQPGATRHDPTERDIETARHAVRELAGAGCGDVDHCLDWAVVTAYAQGRQVLWVATSDGVCYIPHGIYLKKHVHQIAAVDDEFDSRWFGWRRPAEKAVRAAKEMGHTATAAATTCYDEWADDLSEILTDRNLTVEYVNAVGGAKTEAAELTKRRVHRLQTVNWQLYDELAAVDNSQVRQFCRDTVNGVVFGVDPPLPKRVQLVGRALLDQRSPNTAEWAALRTEYDHAAMYLGASRPGLDAVECADQTRIYREHFIQCRRIETLLRWGQDPWEPAEPAEIAYAAILAGVRLSLREYA